nr:regulatory protein, LuxR [Kibdelosporangium sp. MJ126-NF4]
MIPRLRAGTVNRSDLVTALVHAVLSVPLTVVSAPAGYGKTTLAAMVAMSPQIGTCRWLSMDADDNDPRRFLTGLGAVLGPDLAAASTAVLAGNGGPHDVRRAAVALLNAVAESSASIVVVLDEWEVITDPAVQAQLEFLVEWAPETLHFVVTTRHDPPLGLARLRARGMLAERGPHELRFTESEADALLNGSLRLGLPAETVAQVHNRTDGWAAGLRLLATSWGGNREALPPRTGDAHVFAFLAEEVFDQQPPEIRRFLVETSVLSTVSGAACAAVTGRDDAVDVLEELAGRGLFLTERGGRDVYRYHDLFAEFLHRRLARWPSTERTDLYRRAALTEEDPVAAARHLLASGDPRAAAELLESAGTELLRLGRVTSVRELLDSLPEDQRDRPGLLVLSGDLAFAAGDLGIARHAFERAGPSGAVAARLADCLVLQGEVVASDNLIEQALTGPLDTTLHVRLLLTRARLAQIRGRFEVAEQALGAAVDAAVDKSAIMTAAAHMSPTLALIRGGIDDLERFAELARPVLPNGLPGLQVDGISATVDLLRGRLDQATSSAERVLRDYERFGGAPPLLGFSLVAIRLLGTGASMASLEPTVHDLLRYAGLLMRASFMYPNAWFMIGRARWLRGQLAEARQARARMGEQDAPPGSAPTITVNKLSLDGLIAIADGNHRRAEELLRAAVDEEDRLQLVDIYGSARIRLGSCTPSADARTRPCASPRPPSPTANAAGSPVGSSSRARLPYPSSTSPRNAHPSRPHCCANSRTSTCPGRSPCQERRRCSQPARPKCCACSPAARPTGRSPGSLCSARRPSKPTSAAYCANSAYAPAPQQHEPASWASHPDQRCVHPSGRIHR